MKHAESGRDQPQARFIIVFIYSCAAECVRGRSDPFVLHPDSNHFIRSRDCAMRLRIIARWGLVAVTAIGFLALFRHAGQGA